MKRMPFPLALATLALLPIASFAQAPAPPVSTGPASEIQINYERMKGNVIKAAEKMPEADYQFKPTPDIRAYARIVNHITEAHLHYCDALTGATFDPKQVPADTAGKATIVAGLKASFAVCDKAFGALTDSSIAEMVPMGKTARSRIGLAWGVYAHDDEQYAELSTYLRLKGLVPPTSEK